MRDGKSKERTSDYFSRRTVETPADGVQLETYIPWLLKPKKARSRIIGHYEIAGEDKISETGELAKHSQGSALLRAFGLAHHWSRLLEEGAYASIAEIADAEGLDRGQATRILGIFHYWRRT